MLFVPQGARDPTQGVNVGLLLDSLSLDLGKRQVPPSVCSMIICAQ